IAGEAIVTTTSANSILTVVNMSAVAVTLTPVAGGPLAVTAFVVIQQLS
ncbi:MAG: hypothetical protein QOE98_558, partial [Gaiellaceae bacterium]|nr:hypothetical protein [Gaiellaceae bacterium]